MGPQLLVIEDDTDLESSGFGVTIAQRTQIARDALAHRGFDLVIADFMHWDGRQASSIGFVLEGNRISAIGVRVP